MFWYRNMTYWTSGEISFFNACDLCHNNSCYYHGYRYICESFADVLSALPEVIYQSCYPLVPEKAPWHVCAKCDNPKIWHTITVNTDNFAEIVNWALVEGLFVSEAAAAEIALRAAIHYDSESLVDLAMKMNPHCLEIPKSVVTNRFPKLRSQHFDDATSQNHVLPFDMTCFESDCYPLLAYQRHQYHLVLCFIKWGLKCDAYFLNKILWATRGTFRFHDMLSTIAYHDFSAEDYNTVTCTMISCNIDPECKADVLRLALRHHRATSLLIVTYYTF